MLTCPHCHSHIPLSRQRHGLTSQQKALLDFIDDFINQNGFSPSYDEMREALGLHSKSGVHMLVKALEERGFIRRLPNRARSIEVV